MQISSRAGLIALIVAFFTVLSAAAPVTSHSASLSRGHSTYTSDLAERPASSIAQGSDRRPGVLLYRRSPELEVPVLVRRHVAAKVKTAFHKLGQGIKHAAQKVGHFTKNTGAKVAKFGLKIASTTEKVASKFVGFIPGVGKPIAKAMEAHSAALNAVSDKIHVKLPGKLQKGVNVLNKVRKVSGYVPRDLADLEERDGFKLEERDFFEDTDIYAREWVDWEDGIY